MLAKCLITLSVLMVALSSASSGNASRVQVGAQRVAEVETATSGDPMQELREEFHQTYPLSPNGRISLENLNGNVRIAAWERNDVQVDAVKRAYRRERLNEAKIEVMASADAVRIKTVYPDWDQTFTSDSKGRYNNPAIVDYTITVPRNSRLESIDLINGSLDVHGVEGDVKASSINGKVAARGLMGITKLSTVNGSLEATFSKLDESKPINLGSVNGNVVLVIPSDANAIVRAGTVHGGISNEFGLGVQHGDYVGHELYGQLGTGGPRVRLENVNGRITIRHAQDGRPLSPATCLLPEKKDKAKAEQEREEERERRHEEMAEQHEAIRIQREAQVEAQREMERSLRETQREIERAQREIQREGRRDVREHMRRERVEAEGRGAGRGSGYKVVTQRESKSFTVSGSPRVNIMTFDGPVKVHGWDKQEVSYTAEKQGSDEDELKLIEIQTEQQGSAVSIIAKAGENTGSASLEVFVPRKATLHVSSDDGELNLEGVSGDLTLRTGDGSIKVSNGSGQLQVNTGDGEIRITNFDGQVDARTGDGPISIDGNFVGLAARTGDGPITLSVPSNANFTIETNAEGIDNSGLTVSEDLAPSGRVKRWKVGRGGNVFVLSTGEGRIMLHSR